MTGRFAFCISVNVPRYLCLFLKKQCRQDACTALDWVTGLFFQSGRLLGLIMQAIATIIGADLGGFADEFGACFEESLFIFFHDVPPVF